MIAMSRQKRNNSEKETGRVGKLFRWTVLLALVFSAGLITGQRVLTGGPDELPFIALSATAPTRVEAAPAKMTFSFYETLSNKKGTPVIEAAPPVASPREVEAEIPADIVASVQEALTQPANADGARYTIQVASHPSRAMATRELARLRAMGLDAHIVAAESDGGRFYRVRLGKFATLEQVNASLARFNAEGKIKGFVTPF